jgi:hypothetical protein
MMTIRIIGAAIATATSGRLGRLAEPMASVRSTGRIILLARGVGLVGAFGLAAVGLKLAEPLGAAAPLAFTVRSFESLHRRAFVVDADGRMHGGDTELGYRVRLGELDGVAPAELVSTWVGERTVWSLGGEGWEDPQDIEPTIEPDFVVDFDGDGLDDLVGQESGGIEVWRNLGCLGG